MSPVYTHFLPNNSLERTPPQQKIAYEARSRMSGLLRCKMIAGPLTCACGPSTGSSQPLGAPHETICFWICISYINSRSEEYIHVSVSKFHPLHVN